MAGQDKEIVLISGGNTGLGFEIARKLLQEYAKRFHVIIGSRMQSKGETAVKTLEAEGHHQIEFVQMDVTDEASLAIAAQAVAKRHGRVDVLHVNVSSRATIDG